MLAAALLAGAAAADAPQRVVSINLCTDQMAMMLAAPGQLVSVSYLAADPRSSTMVEAAQAYPLNRSGAEEIYLLDPDLVLGGTWSTPATVSMLERLGVRVETFPPATSLDEAFAQLRDIGRLMGREARAEQIVAHAEARLAALPPVPSDPPRAALYGANGATSGMGGLSGEILARAGFANITAELDLPDTGTLALERLVLAAPDIVIASQLYPGRSRAEAILDHPAFLDLRDRTNSDIVTDADWVCALPQTIDAIERLAALRLSLGEGS